MVLAAAASSVSAAVRPRRRRVSVRPCATLEKQPQPEKDETTPIRVSFIGGIPVSTLTSKERQQKMMADLAVVRFLPIGSSQPVCFAGDACLSWQKLLAEHSFAPRR